VVVATLVVPAAVHCERLRAHDVSILFPLAASGKGLRNTPILGEPFVTRSQFDAFARTILGMGNEKSCPAARDPATLFSADEELMSADIHLARARGLPEGACAPPNWRVVGFRFDPCVERPEKSHLRDRRDLTGCTAEVRLEAQPFFEREDGWASPDVAAHLIYDVPSLDPLIADLRQLHELTASFIGEAPGAIGDATEELGPHPGLQAEMARRGGPVTTAVHRLLTRYAHHTALKQLAWMTSSRAHKQWTFGRMRVVGGRLVQEAIKAGGRFDNYDQPIFASGEGFPLNRNLRGETHPFPSLIRLFQRTALLLSEAPLDDAERGELRAAARGLDIIQDGRRVGQDGTTCVSCHLVDSVMLRAAENAGDRSRPTMNDPLPQRGFLSFRQFGYEPGFVVAVSQRTRNTTADIVRILSTLYP
jgi:hypothetical protein